MLAEAKARLLAGEVVAYSTETSYGLAVDPRNREAVARLLDIKGRDVGAGISLIIDSALRLEQFVANETPQVKEQRLKLQARFWPGPLTFVIQPNKTAIELFSPEIFAKDGSLALRQSPVVLAGELARLCGGAITATSANPRGEEPARSAAEVRAYFPDIFVLSGNMEHGQRPSTIVDVRSLPFKILREGAVSI